MSDVIAIIPARSGSKSVLDKNIAPLNGFPLIAYSIAIAKMSRHVSRVIVSTDSEDYARLARQWGVEVPFLRPAEFSTDESTDRDFLVHAMQWFEQHEGHCPEYWLHLRPTTPLRTSDIVDTAIDEIIKSPEASSLRSGHQAPESPLKWFTRDSQGYFRGLGQDDGGKERYNLPKEVFESVFIPDGYVDVVRSSFVLSHLGIHGDNMVGFESPVCTEVDSQQELDYIRYQLDTQGSSLFDYMQQNFKQLRG